MRNMKAVFVSNYYNHHQSEFSKAMYEKTNGNFVFIQILPMEEERINMGWGDISRPSYVKYSYSSDAEYRECLELIYNADLVIAGGCREIERMIRHRIAAKKLVFRYSERLYKNKKLYFQIPFRFIKYHWVNRGSRNTYMLCASAYAAKDYALTGNFINKTYKFGYFPKLKIYDIDELIKNKKKNSILWVARFISVKHPEIAVSVAERLKKDGYDFELNMIGNGELFDTIRRLIMQKGLEDRVKLLGSMTPDQVRMHMERSEIFMFTSDRGEGWGAVLNESMNSACAVVANSQIGSTPFLIDDGENGLIYDGNIDLLYSHIKSLLDDETKREKISKSAYDTMINDWNADVAAERVLTLAKNITEGKDISYTYGSGICSIARRNIKEG